MEVAVTGIDGSGKTTLVSGLVKYLRRRGIDVGYIDCPYFRAVPGLERLSRLLERGWHWVGLRQSKFFFSLLSFLAAIVYFTARWKLRKRDILLVEHHPRVDMVPYARLYAGPVGSLLAGLIVRLWPKARIVIRISVAPEIAYGRLIRRGRRLQPHETVPKLRQLDSLIAASAQKSALELHVLKEKEPEPGEVIASCLHINLAGKTRQPN